MRGGVLSVHEINCTKNNIFHNLVAEVKKLSEKFWK